MRQSSSWQADQCRIAWAVSGFIGGGGESGVVVMAVQWSGMLSLVKTSGSLSILTVRGDSDIVIVAMVSRGVWRGSWRWLLANVRSSMLGTTSCLCRDSRST